MMHINVSLAMDSLPRVLIEYPLNFALFTQIPVQFNVLKQLFEKVIGLIAMVTLYNKQITNTWIQIIHYTLNYFYCKH